MKIKNQFRLFLLGIIAVPLLCAIFVPVYSYFTRADRLFFDGYKQIMRQSSSPMSGNDIEALKDALRLLPPKIEFTIIENCSAIIYTNFRELEDESEIDAADLFRHMRETSGMYFYQFVSPQMADKNTKILIVSRISRAMNEMEKKAGKRRHDSMIAIIVLFIAAFEAYCITMTIKISGTITKSITLLEKKTQRIANGELDVEIQNTDPKHDNEITRLAENLDRMRIALKDDSERRSRFIMGISHDLRTPVAVIKGYTEALSDGIADNPEEMRKSLDIISSKADQLATMINTLINFVKLNQTDWQHQLKKQRFAPAMREFAKTFVTTGEIFKRKVEATVNIPDDTEIPFDKLLVQRALENLFANAVRYTKDGDTIRIDAQQDGGKITLKISDTGIGIEKKDIGKIFDMFYRGTNSRRESGMGIGLSVVKTIISTHGWNISVKSQKGIGTEFTVEIPLTEAPQETC